MKNILMMAILFGGFFISVAQAQTCVTPCPPECCIASCNPVKGSAASVQLMPASNVAAATCTPEQIAACLGGKKISKKEMKECQKACAVPAKAACVAPGATPSATETAIDKTYHQAPKPTKS
jgi:hypothetical protein